jgi:hypothetical protein
MTEHILNARPEVVIHAEAVFDPVAACILGRVLAGISGPSVAVVDFGHCREVDAWALALLAQEIANAREVEVELRGLSRHQERVLRYFGVEIHASGR